jgi:DNA modification methylase
MEIRTLPISKIKPATYNPRNITDDELDGLIASLEIFGQQENLIVNKDMTLISGHQRMKAMEQLGWKEVVCNVVDLDKHQEKKLNVIMNSQAIQGSWDDLKLNEILEELQFDEDYNRLRLNEIEPVKIAVDLEEDDVPELDQGKTYSEPGKVYQLGRHKVMCGDATTGDIHTLLKGETAQMCFTDPPYNVDYQGGASGTWGKPREGIKNDKMSKVAFYNFLKDSLANAINNTKGGIYVCMSSSELETLKAAFEDAGGHWQSYIIWVKNTFTLTRADYQHTYEPILYGWPAKTKNHYFIEDRSIPNVWEDLKEIKSEFDGDYTTIKFQGYEVKIAGKAEGQVKRRKQVVDIWRYNKPTRSSEHPTMKPIDLCANAIKNSSKRNDIVLDVFAGSGSTLIAAESTGRTARVMELDPKYVDVIRKRWYKLTHETDEGWEEGTPEC